MLINHIEHSDQRDHVSATNYGLRTPNSHSVVVRHRSAVPSLRAIMVQSACRTLSKPVQPLKTCEIPQTNVMNHPDLTNPIPIPMNSPSSKAPSLSSMWLSSSLSLAMIPLPNLPVRTAAKSKKPWENRFCTQSALGLFLIRRACLLNFCVEIDLQKIPVIPGTPMPLPSREKTSIGSFCRLPRREGPVRTPDQAALARVTHRGFSVRVPV